MANPKTALQLLQSLDQDFATLQEQLLELENIVFGFETSSAESQNEGRIGQPPRRGRSRWALRWIFKKLHAQHKDPEACLDPFIWRILTRVITTLGIVETRKDLVSHRILDCLDKTLSAAVKLYGWEDLYLINPDTLQKLGANFDGASETINQHLDGVEVHKPAKKRGLDSPDPERAIKRRKAWNGESLGVTKDLSSSPGSLFDALAEFLACTMELDPSASVSETQESYTKLISPFSNAPPATAARILGGWLRAMSVASTDSSSGNLEALTTGLNAVQHIWDDRNQSVASASFTESVMLCSAETLVPASVVLLAMHEDTVNSFGSHGSLGESIERFLGKEILMQTRSSMANKPEHDSSNSRIRDGSSDQEFQKVLNPISELSTQDINTSTASAISKSLANLFMITIKCTPINSPKKKVLEQAWLESVFEQICQCCHVHFDKSAPKPTYSFLQSELLKLLLTACHAKKLSISSTILSQIAETICDQNIPQSEPMNWLLLQRLVALNPDVFLSPDTSQPSKRNRSSESLDNRLFARVTKTQLLEKECCLDSSYAYADDYVCVRDSILIPLFEAYCGARMTGVFLDQWCHGLTDGFPISRANTKISIWEDDRLFLVLSEKLSRSMAANQVESAISERLAELERCLKRAPSPSEIHRAMASLVIIAALLNAALGDPLLKVIGARNASKILKVALEIAEKIPSTLFKERFHLWRLVSLAHHLWSSEVEYPPPSDESMMGERAIDQIAKEFASSESPSAAGDYTSHLNNLAVVSCLGTVLEDSQARHWDLSHLVRNLPLGGLIAQQREAIANLEQRNNTYAWAFDHILADFPILIEPHGQESLHSMDLLKRMMGLEISLSGMRELPRHLTERPWYKLLHASLQGSPGLFDLILESLLGVNLQAGSHEEAKAGEHTESLRELAEISYLQIPIERISRGQRKNILNELVQNLLVNGMYLNSSQWIRKLSLIFHLLNPRFGSTSLGLRYEDIEKLVRSVEQHILAASDDGEDVLSDNIVTDIRDIVEEISRICIRHELHTSNEGSASILIRKLKQILEFRSSRALDGLKEHHSILIVLLEMINEQTKSRTETAEALRHSLVQICTQICDLGAEHSSLLESGCYTAYHVANMACFIELLDKIPSNILQKHQFSVESMVTIAERAVQSNRDKVKEGDWIKGLLDKLEVRTNMLVRKLYSQKFNALDLQRIYDLLDRDLPLKTQAMLEMTIVDDFVAHEAEHRANILLDLLDDCRAATPAQERSRWHNLNIIFAGAIELKDKEGEPIIPVASIPLILITLATALRTVSHTHTFLTICSGISTLLRHTTSLRAITQPAVDSMLSAAAALSHSSTKPNALTLTPKMYAALTSLQRILLLQHRKRLSGRFHLLIAGLQALLRPLFASLQRSGTLTSSAQTKSLHTLTSKHAEHFTRLVTLLCDPPVSSITTRYVSQSKQASLIDETRKARRHAGCFVHHLLLSLCDMQLRGRFVADGVREPLVPAVYAMFDAMGPSMLGAVYNGDGDGEAANRVGMSVGVRTVFRGWWEAWKQERERRSA